MPYQSYKTLRPTTGGSWTIKKPIATKKRALVGIGGGKIRLREIMHNNSRVYHQVKTNLDCKISFFLRNIGRRYCCCWQSGVSANKLSENDRQPQASTRTEIST